MVDRTCITQGTDHLTVTWKVEEDILHHIDIREQGKPNQYSLGKSLWIGNDVRLICYYVCFTSYTLCISIRESATTRIFKEHVSHSMPYNNLHYTI